MDDSGVRRCRSSRGSPKTGRERLQTDVQGQQTQLAPTAGQGGGRGKEPCLGATSQMNTTQLCRGEMVVVLGTSKGPEEEDAASGGNAGLSRWRPSPGDAREGTRVKVTEPSP